MGARTGRAARKNPTEVYRVTAYGKTNMYETKAGLEAKLRGLMSVGTLPQDITVEVMPANWSPHPDYQGVCFSCRKPSNLPNDECKLQRSRRIAGRLPHPEEHTVQGM